MNTTSNPQQPLIFPSDDTSMTPLTVSPLTPPLPLPSVPPPSLPRTSILIDHRIKMRASGVDLDANKLSTTIKRSQAISNIQDLDEDSPVTFVIAPNDLYHHHHHHHVRKKVQLQTSALTHRTSDESLASITKQQTNSSGGGDESDTRSECSEKMPEFIEEERPILPGIHVKGATLNRLIRTLIDSFRKWRRKHKTFVIQTRNISFRSQWNSDRR